MQRCATFSLHCRALDLDLSTFPTLRGAPGFASADLGDAPSAHALRQDPRTTEHIGRPRGAGLADAEDLIRRTDNDRTTHQGISWGIALHEQPQLMGTIGCYRLKLDHHRGEIGHMLSPDHWSQGLMSEGLKAALTGGSDQFHFQQH